MNILLLDFDGVVNSRKWYNSVQYKENNYKDPDVDPEIINLLNNLTNKLNLKIVISSSWKYDKGFSERLGRIGLDNVIDKTPDLVFSVSYDKFCKGLEVEEYLNKHPEVSNYVILDDEDEFYGEQLIHFIQTNYKTGFTLENYKECLKRFSK